MLKKLLPACLIMASALVLFACSKDDSPQTQNPPAKDPRDSAIQGIYFRYTFKGHTELFKHPVDTIGLMYYFSTTYTMWMGDRDGEDKHKTYAGFEFGSVWQTGTGNFVAQFNLDTQASDSSWENKRILYTIKRSAATFGDTVEVTFKGLLTQVDAVGTPDTGTVTGDFRAVLVKVP